MEKEKVPYQTADAGEKFDSTDGGSLLVQGHYAMQTKSIGDGGVGGCGSPRQSNKHILRLKISRVAQPVSTCETHTGIFISPCFFIRSAHVGE